MKQSVGLDIAERHLTQLYVETQKVDKKKVLLYPIRSSSNIAEKFKNRRKQKALNVKGVENKGRSYSSHYQRDPDRETPAALVND